MFLKAETETDTEMKWKTEQKLHGTSVITKNL